MSWLLLKIKAIKDNNLKEQFINEINLIPMLKSYHCPTCYYDMLMMSTDVRCEGCLEEINLEEKINNAIKNQL
jgi:hypothetical protein